MICSFRLTKSVLALLDFSSTFDTIDLSIIVHHLDTDFGFTDTVLQWLSSFLNDRTHHFSLSNHCSLLFSNKIKLYFQTYVHVIHDERYIYILEKKKRKDIK